MKCDDLAIMEAYIQGFIAGSGKPSYMWGYSSTATNLTYMHNTGSVPSNKTGLPFGLNNGKLIELWIGNSELVAYDITFYHHLGDEVSLTALKTVTVPAAARTKLFDAVALGVVSVPKDVQLAMRVTAVPGGNPKNVGIHATITGTT